MTRRLFGAKPLPKLMLTYFQLEHRERNHHAPKSPCLHPILTRDFKISRDSWALLSIYLWSLLSLWRHQLETIPLCGESIGNRWILLTKGQWRGHLMFLCCQSEPNVEQTADWPVIRDAMTVIWRHRNGNWLNADSYWFHLQHGSEIHNDVIKWKHFPRY